MSRPRGVRYWPVVFEARCRGFMLDCMEAERLACIAFIDRFGEDIYLRMPPHNSNNKNKVWRRRLGDWCRDAPLDDARVGSLLTESTDYDDYIISFRAKVKGL